MKTRILIMLCQCVILAFLLSCEVVETHSDDYITRNELDEKFRSEWDKPEYQVANTAKNETYLSDKEKDVFYYLNLARINPPLFAETYVNSYNGDAGWSKGYAWDERKQSLMAELKKMESLGLIYPDEEMYALAYCFANKAGELGLVGHDRSKTGCSAGFHAECCSYGGAQNGFSIIMSFLIDAGENNAALGHRRICLSKSYDKLGVSIQPHKIYNFNAVLDFKNK